jgi:hypothetical protein
MNALAPPVPFADRLRSLLRGAGYTLVDDLVLRAPLLIEQPPPAVVHLELTLTLPAGERVAVTLTARLAD